MASRKDYYDILGVRRNATGEEIEKAFRKLIRTYQFLPPAQSKAAALCLKEITEAYEILSDKEKRKKYDCDGHVLGYEDYLGDEKDEEEPPLADFEDVFAGSLFIIEQKKDARPRRGKDIYLPLELTFQESIWGGEREIKWQREINCSSCEARGWQDEKPTKICPSCGGAGQIQIGLWPEVLFQTCPVCLGKGKIFRQICPSCSGKGRVKEEAFAPLQIPPGINEGCRIYLMGRGDEGKNGGENGDLIIKIKISKSPLFQKLGYDLYLTIPLPIGDDLLGGEIEVPTLAGHKKVPVPRALPEEGQIRLREEGPPIFLGEGRGDLIIRTRTITLQKSG
ncbi:MAG: DnaJ C-terminal domain-containing protein [Thermodesulfobacteriota bacterium]